MKPQFMGYPLYFSTAVFNDLQVSNASWVLISLELNLFEKNHEKLSSYRESRRGSHIAINDQAERHKVLFKCDRRDILPQRNRYLSTAFCSSPNILAEAEPSTKTSVEYQFQMDSRDNPMMPSSGGLLRFRYSEFEFLLKYSSICFLQHRSGRAFCWCSFPEKSSWGTKTCYVWFWIAKGCIEFEFTFTLG